MQLETIKVKHDHERGFKTINKDDFKKGEHEEYKEGKTKKEMLQVEAELVGVEGFEDMTIAQLEEAIKAEQADM